MRHRLVVRLAVVATLAVVDAVAAPLVGALTRDSRLTPIDVIEVRGNEHTRLSTILRLLPRETPTEFAAAELEELERRLNNLGIFDLVKVAVVGRSLRIEVREKWTLIPSISFATGHTFADTFIAVGVNEYNFLGTASVLGVFLAWQDGGLNGSVFWGAHPYDPKAGAPFVAASYDSSYLDFETGEAWRRDQAGGSFGWQLPYRYRAPLHTQPKVFGYHERISSGVGGDVPRSGFAIGTGVEATWDSFTWHDLVPRGYSLTVDVVTAGFFPALQPRHEATFRGSFGAPLSSTTVVLGQLIASAVAGHNVNHSLLLSSWQEVRGLTDSFYRNQAQGTVNLELRQAWRFAERWALQGALFSDAAVFKSFDAHGHVGGPQSAWGVGAGVRLIPTLVANVVPRVDFGRLLKPDQRWFFQLGLAQYF